MGGEAGIDLGDQDIARLGAGEQLAHLGGILQAGPPDRVVAERPVGELGQERHFA